MNAAPQEIMETQLRREGDIAILTINNVKRRNALSAQVKVDMYRHLNAALDDKTCRAIVLTGAGNVFCSGADVKAMGAKSQHFIDRRLERYEGSGKIVPLLIGGPKPVVTAVEGPAVGVGLSLAIASDITVAATNARFAAAWIRRGLCPDGFAYYTLSARCGPGRARELLLSGREFNGIEAEKYGIVHELAEPGKALEVAMATAARLAALPPLAYALTKAAMTHSYQSPEAAFRAEQDYQPVVALSKDHKESVAAFLEKRKPVFTGE